MAFSMENFPNPADISFLEFSGNWFVQKFPTGQRRNGGLTFSRFGMLADELQIFGERNGLAQFSLDGDGVARTFLEGVGELTIDASYVERTCVYVFIPYDHPPVPMLLLGLHLCNQARLVGMPMNFVADSSGRIGFMIILHSKQLYADNLGMAFAQILQALVRIQQG
jgi:hypothetical protein